MVMSGDSLDINQMLREIHPIVVVVSLVGRLYAMDYINIASKGNSLYFGNFSTASGGIGDGAKNETAEYFVTG